MDALDQIENYVFDLQRGFMTNEYRELEPTRHLGQLHTQLRQVRREVMALQQELIEYKQELTKESAKNSDWAERNLKVPEAS